MNKRNWIFFVVCITFPASNKIEAMSILSNCILLSFISDAIMMQRTNTNHYQLQYMCTWMEDSDYFTAWLLCIHSQLYLLRPPCILSIQLILFSFLALNWFHFNYFFLFFCCCCSQLEIDVAIYFVKSSCSMWHSFISHIFSIDDNGHTHTEK